MNDEGAMNDEEKLYVINRDGEHKDVDMEEITFYLNQLMRIKPRLKNIDTELLAKKAIDSMIPGIKTREINDLLAEEAACMARQSEEYVVLAGRIAILNMHHNVTQTYKTWLKKMKIKSGSDELSYTMVVRRLYENYYKKDHAPIISAEIHSFMCDSIFEDDKPLAIHSWIRDGIFEDDIALIEARLKVENAINHNRDYDMYTYFGIMTLIRKYLSKDLITDVLLELPQHMLMTVSLGIHGIDNLDDAIQTYALMSHGFFTHATPTLLNGGRRINQMASCYLLTMGGDSLTDIAECMRRCMMISQGGGGIGISATPLRARGSIIKTMHGKAHGVCHELLRVFNSLAKYVDQGGGKRKGAFAVYLEPWHADVEEFIDLRAINGNMDMKCNDLNIGLWINDLFMERVLNNEPWSLFCPTDAPKLCDAYGKEFDALYEQYERQGLARKTLPAVELWYKILDKQQEVSEPYMMYKDACNRKSNQKNLGTIRGSNLCVAGDTLVLTGNGELPIASLEGKTVILWNGNEWSEGVKIVKTGTAKDLVRVRFGNGAHLDCTPEHEFYLQKSDDSKTPPKVPASNLQTGDELLKWKLPLCVPHAYGSLYSVRVVSVEPLSTKQDTFCFTEPKRHMGMFNGVQTGQCTEIIEYTSKDEIAVCVLMSFALPKYVVLAHETERLETMRKEYGEEEVEQICRIEDTENFYDFILLARHVGVGVENLNRVIDRMHYPDEAARKSSMTHRPVGMGVQGLADVFGMLEISWDSAIAREINHTIFRTIYEAGLRGSMECAKVDGPYETYEGSPASKGIFQPGLWQDERLLLEKKYTAKYGKEYVNTFFIPASQCVLVNEKLKREIAEHGLRNSLLVAPMPTASTAQILGNNECIEPVTSNIYTRATGAGDFIVYNKHLVHSLKKRGLWDTEMRNSLYSNSGSVQNIERVPEHLKNVYKTVWEIKQSLLITLAAERGHYIDQSQSLNLHVAKPTRAVLNSLHFLTWRMKLKGSYYIRRQAESSATSFTSVSIAAPAVEAADGKRKHAEEASAIETKKARIQGACPLNSVVGEGDPEACDMCSG